MKHTITLDIHITPEDAAEAFSGMDDGEQVIFFNHLAERVALWGAPFEVQMQSVHDLQLLTPEAKVLIAVMNDYLVRGKND